MAGQIPRYTGGVITSYATSPSGTFNSESDRTRTGGRWVNGVWVKDQPQIAPSPVGSPAITPDFNIPSYNGSNPPAPATSPAVPGFGDLYKLLPSYGQDSVAPTATVTGAGSGSVGGSALSFSQGNYNTDNFSPAPTTTTDSFPPLPTYSQVTDPRLAALEEQSLKNIGSGLRGELPADVIQGLTQRGAERGLSVGSNSPNAGAAILRALGLTSLDLQQVAEKNLQPYQDRSAAVNLANIGEQGMNYRALLDASQAMKRLQLSESGQMARLTIQEKGDLQRQILAGQQSMQQLKAKGGIDLAMALISATAEQQNIILKGSQAMEQLRLSETAQGQRLSAQLKVELEKQAIAGQQAMEQLGLSGAQAAHRTELSSQYRLDEILQKYKLDERQDERAKNDYKEGLNYGNQSQQPQQYELPKYAQDVANATSAAIEAQKPKKK